MMPTSRPPLPALELPSLSPGFVFGSGGSSPNPNLLLWTEEFQQATWVKSSASVSADATSDPLGGSTADRIVMLTGTGSVSQISTTAATTGSVSTTIVPTSTWTRFSASTTFDTGVFTFAVWLLDPLDNASDLQLRMAVSGGFIQCAVRDGGDVLTFYAWGAKLETGNSATGTSATYGKRDGT